MLHLTVALGASKQAESDYKATQIRALMERVGGDALFLEKLMLMSEKNKATAEAGTDASAKNSTSGSALIIPTTNADGVEIATRDADVDVVVNKLSSREKPNESSSPGIDVSSPPPLPHPGSTSSTNVNGDDPYLNEDDDIVGGNKKMKDGGGGGNNRLESESKAVEDSAQRETPAVDDEAPNKGINEEMPKFAFSAFVAF